MVDQLEDKRRRTICGLLGFATTEKLPGHRDRAGFLHQGLIDSMWRGSESTGVAFIRHGEDRKSPEVYKDSVCAFDFCRRPWMERALHHMDDYSIAIGHTRSATRGAGLTPRNAHPFQYNHITLAHNGTIDNSWDLVPLHDRPNDVTVDSDIVALAMGRLNEKENEKIILEKLRGAYTLVWHNARDGSLNIARNERKPLFFCYLKKENSMFWASEYTLLCHLLERRGLHIEGKVSYPEPMKWYKFQTKDLRRWSVSPFVSQPHILPMGRRWVDQVGAESRNGRTIPNQMNDGKNPAEYQEPSPEELAELRLQLKNNGNLDIDDDKALKDWLRARKGNTTLKQSGVPSTLKKVQQAARSLRVLGYGFNMSTRLLPVSWTPYKKNREKLGQVTGTSPNGSLMVMHNVLRTSWDKYAKYRKVYVSCINVRRLDNNKIAIVCIEHPKHKELMEKFFRAENNSGGDPQNSDPTALVYIGPHGQKVSKERFLELTKAGCSNCTSDISPEDHEDVIWLGAQDNEPVCKICAEDPDFWTYINASPTDYIRERLTH